MLICGVDEVGRGPLAGPVVAAAVILPKRFQLEGLTDSKRLSAKRRECLADEIRVQAIAYAIARASVDEIDELNIHHASLLAMQRAVQQLSQTPDKALVDGKFIPQLQMPAEAIIKGDLHEPCISAASIIAKVERDNEMIRYDQTYPGYGLASNMGYPSKAHIEALADLGVTPIHRRSYRPVQLALNQRGEAAV